MTVAALVVGAGRGERYRASLPTAPEREYPKALLLLGGRPLLVRAAEALAAAPEISLVVPVVPAGLLSELSGLDVESHPAGWPADGGLDRASTVVLYFDGLD